MSEAEIRPADRPVLRRLAGRVAELAARPIEQEKRDLWYRHNALEPTRPVIYCNPENAWNEIIPQDSLECVGTLARAWEFGLRAKVFWGESMGDDMVVEPVFSVHCVTQDSDWGMHETIVHGRDGGSYTWDPPLKSYDDLDKLRYPTISVDEEATERHVEQAQAILGDLLTVKRKGSPWWPLGMGMTWIAITLRGLEQFMLDMCVCPDDLKRLMAFLRDGTLAKVDFLEQNGLLDLNNDDAYVGSGGLGYTRELPQPDFDGRVRACDLWGFAESQETTSVAPDQFAELVFPYQVPILERFGLNCYGCCEPLDLRWHIVKQAPRLRRISVAPWSDRETMAQHLADRYIYSMKPNPAPLASPTLDEEFIRKSLRRDLDVTRGCRVEVVMKDTHTIARKPENVIAWCRIAREEADAL